MQGRPPCLDIELAGSMALLYSHEYTQAPCLKVQLGKTLLKGYEFHQLMESYNII